ncbi:hypothetical protein IJJ97_05625 [bacterium]|nr:hypothetical protein [bacterium]
MRTKTNDMSTIKIPQNGLPQEIANIPFGQVIVLTDPTQGITSKTIKTVEFIHSVARKLDQKRHIVNSLPVDAAGLWGCVICKVKTDDGVQILVSDWDSLLEMLCDFWGLDYEEISKIPDIIPGWHKTHKGVTIGGESHPLRIPVPVRKPEKEETEVGSTLIQCITVHTKEGEMAKIEDILVECALYGIVISPYELMGIQEKVGKRERKTYQLDIDIIPGKEDWDKDFKEKVVKRTIDIIITDSAGIKHHITDLSPQSAALYLTFILFKDGIKIADLKTNDEFYNLFIHICNRLKSTNKLPDKITLWKNANRKRGEIKKAISDVTNDDKNAEMMFGIEGEEGKENRVAGVTDELREKIRKGFDIE